MRELQAGDPMVIGPYRIAGRLGDGGLGRVYLGLSADGKSLAVRVIRAELAADVDFRVRLGREVAAARRVDDRYTALIVDADVEAAEPWLATAYVAGPSLAEAIGEHGPLPVRPVLALTAGLAEGLAAIHAVGVVHGHLRPSNVLLAGDGPRLTDFGISRVAEVTSATYAGPKSWSAAFMAPEHIQGGPAGPASDIFSAGAVLAFAASGEAPFGGGSTAALVHRVMHSRPNLTGLPGEVRPIIERCLAKDPGQRPTVAELMAAAGTVYPMAGWLPEPVLREFTPHGEPRVPPVREDLDPTREDLPSTVAGPAAAGAAPAALPLPAELLISAPAREPGRERPLHVGAHRRRVLAAVFVVVLAMAAGVGFGLAGNGSSPARARTGAAVALASSSSAVVITSSAPSSAPATSSSAASHGAKPKPVVSRRAVRPTPSIGSAPTTIQPVPSTQPAAVPTPSTEPAPRPSSRAPATHPPATHASKKPSQKPAPKPTRKTTAPSISVGATGASEYSCSAVGSVASAPSSDEVLFTFVNKSSAAVQVIWLGFSREPVLYDTVSPGGSYQVNTYVGHYWELAISGGSCLAVFDIGGTGQISISG
jgi:eukaryotic-like serine/threonine-protein kinase